MLDWFDDPEQGVAPAASSTRVRPATRSPAPSNRLGELRDRTFENQRHRASGLTLLAAAVTRWNTVYLDRAVRHLRASDVEVQDELLAHVAPLGWDHIGLTGDDLGRWTNPASGSGLSAYIRTVGTLSVRFPTSSHRSPLRDNREGVGTQNNFPNHYRYLTGMGATSARELRAQPGRHQRMQGWARAARGRAPR